MPFACAMDASHARDERTDFGTKFAATRCSTCQCLTRNRGCAACSKVFCRHHYAEHHALGCCRDASNAQLEDRETKVRQFEIRNRALDAALKRQEQASVQNDAVRQFKRMHASQVKDVADAKGNLVKLNEQGYAEIVALKSSATMEVFVARLATKMGLEFVDDDKLTGWVPYLSGEKGSKQFSAVVSELVSMAAIPNHWCRRCTAAAPQEPAADAISPHTASEAINEKAQALARMSPEDRAVVESLLMAGEVDPVAEQALVKLQEDMDILPFVMEDASARARQMLLERQRVKGKLGPQDVTETTEELKAQYRSGFAH